MDTTFSFELSVDENGLNLGMDTSEQKLDFSMEVGSGGSGKLPDYSGNYTIKPKITSQVLPTKNKSMTDDLTILQIPYTEAGNIGGGKTVVIGFE